MNKTALLISTALTLSMVTESFAMAWHRLQPQSAPKVQSPISKDAQCNALPAGQIAAFRAARSRSTPGRSAVEWTPPAQLREAYAAHTSRLDTLYSSDGFCIDFSSRRFFYCETDCTIMMKSVFAFEVSYDYSTFVACALFDGIPQSNCFSQNFNSGQNPAGWRNSEIIAAQSFGPGVHWLGMVFYDAAPAYYGPAELDFHVYEAAPGHNRKGEDSQ